MSKELREPKSTNLADYMSGKGELRCATSGLLMRKLRGPLARRLAALTILFAGFAPMTSMARDGAEAKEGFSSAEHGVRQALNIGGIVMGGVDILTGGADALASYRLSQAEKARLAAIIESYAQKRAQIPQDFIAKAGLLRPIENSTALRSLVESYALSLKAGGNLSVDAQNYKELVGNSLGEMGAAMSYTMIRYELLNMAANAKTQNASLEKSLRMAQITGKGIDSDDIKKRAADQKAQMNLYLAQADGCRKAAEQLFPDFVKSFKEPKPGNDGTYNMNRVWDGIFASRRQITDKILSNYVIEYAGLIEKESLSDTDQQRKMELAPLLGEYGQAMSCMYLRYSRLNEATKIQKTDKEGAAALREQAQMYYGIANELNPAFAKSFESDRTYVFRAGSSGIYDMSKLPGVMIKARRDDPNSGDYKLARSNKVQEDNLYASMNRDIDRMNIRIMNAQSDAKQGLYNMAWGAAQVYGGVLGTINAQSAYEDGYNAKQYDPYMINWEAARGSMQTK